MTEYFRNMGAIARIELRRALSRAVNQEGKASVWRQVLCVGAQAIGLGCLIGAGLLTGASLITLAGISPLVPFSGFQMLMAIGGLLGQSFVWFQVPNMITAAEVAIAQLVALAKRITLADQLIELNGVMNGGAQ